MVYSKYSNIVVAILLLPDDDDAWSRKTRRKYKKKKCFSTAYWIGNFYITGGFIISKVNFETSTRKQLSYQRIYTEKNYLKLYFTRKYNVNSVVLIVLSEFDR